MRKLKTLLRRIRNMSFERMNTQITKIHEETGKARLIIFLDMIWCSLKYGVGYLDYHVFGFATKHGVVRKTYMTMNHNLATVRRMNNKSYYCFFEDKAVFNRAFADYIGREWLDLRHCDADAFTAFCKDKNAVFAKPVDECGGNGVTKVDCRSVDTAALYEELKASGRVLVEQELTQHPEMNRLHAGSVNTMRVVTLLDGDGQPHVMYALLRIGQGSSCVDNISSGGMYSSVLSDGRLKGPAFCDKTGAYYDVHPDTGTVINTFVVPYFEQSCDMCKQAALIEPHMGYIGWDVAITPDGPVLIEGNSIPGYDMCQNSAHRDSGILPEFEKVMTR